jgi:hypothetical protein
VFIGDSTVTTTSGYRVGVGETFDVPTTAAVYGVRGAAASAKVYVIEAFDDSRPPVENGMVGWWRADLIPGATEGALIGRWPDQSGNGMDLTQTNDVNKPTYLSSGIGGRPTLRFVDTTVVKQLTGPTDSYAAAHLVFVLRIVADGFFANRSLAGIEGAGAARAMLNTDTNDNVAPHQIAATHTPGGELIQPPDEIANLQTVKAFLSCTVGPGGTMTLRYNGADKGSVAITDPTLLGGGFRVGSTGAPTQFDFAEVIFYNRVLSSGEIAALEAYLTQRYGS